MFTPDIQERIAEFKGTGHIEHIVQAAITLDIFEILDRKALLLSELARSIEADPLALRRLMVVLRSLGLVEIHDGHFRNSDQKWKSSVSDLLTQVRAPRHSSNFIKKMLQKWAKGDKSAQVGPLYRLWPHLASAVKEGGPQWHKVPGGKQGGDVFNSSFGDPNTINRYCAIMNLTAIPAGTEIAQVFDFSRFNKVVDIAGGVGGLLAEVCSQFSNLRGIIMELPEVCRLADDYIRARGFDGIITTVEGDLFSGQYPTGADIIILSSVMHDWNDEHCGQILGKAFQALPNGGVLLLSECVLNEDYSGKVYAEILSLMMLLAHEHGARERTETEFRSLLSVTGFENIEFRRLKGPRDLVVAHKA